MKLRARLLPELYDTRFKLLITVSGTKFEVKKSVNAFLCAKVKIIFNLFRKQYERSKKDPTQVHVIDARMAQVAQVSN